MSNSVVSISHILHVELDPYLTFNVNSCLLCIVVLLCCILLPHGTSLNYLSFHLSIYATIGNFAPGSENGTIMKKSDQNERTALMALMDDVLKPYVPEFKRMVEKDEESILNLYSCHQVWK